MPVAITRGVSPRIGSCELTHLARTPIDIELARGQHRRYEAALAKLGCQVVTLPPLADFPDSVFVEDVAVVFDEVAVVTRPGAESRRPEAEYIREALVMFRPVKSIRTPGELDGGDVLRVGKRVYVGRSGRSNQAGIDQLRSLVESFGYRVISVPVRGCLHLKSAVSEATPGVLLVNPEWVHPAAFGGEEMIEIDPAEPYAANGLLITTPAHAAPTPAAQGIPARREDSMSSTGRVEGSPAKPTLIYPASFPRTQRILESGGIRLEVVDVSELQKAEGAVTCCSLILSS